MCENEHEKPTDFFEDYSASEEIVCKSPAEALLYEFTERFLANGNPTPEAYIRAYPNHDRENFAKMLFVTQLLLNEGVKRRRQKRNTKDLEETENHGAKGNVNED